MLTHQAVIDAAWDHSIKPLLLRRFPASTADELIEAHAYAYGGCIIHDMGYYPFGSKFFSDLAHYARSGDFVLNLITGAQDLNEYAFALGALAHYAGDTEGHPDAVNLAVPLEYPKLKLLYGDKATYEDDPAAHLKVEFGFDVLQVARGNYAPESYHDFIGFKVSKPALERAFRGTYSLELSKMFKSVDLAIGTYRHTVSGLIPEMTKVAWALKSKELSAARPGLTRQRFVYNLSQASYNNEWGEEYEKPGIGARVLAFLFRLIPKVGPFKAAAFKPPSSRTAELFEASFNATLDAYRKLLAETARGRLQLVNRNLDTGSPTRPGEYRRADDTYADLAARLADEDPQEIDPKLRQGVLAFFSDPDAPIATKRDPKRWRKTVDAIGKLSETAGAP